MSSYHYLYRITNLVEQKHYYGIRTSKDILPHQDLGVKYFSSSTDKEFISDQKEHPENYRYKVILIIDTRKRVAELEIKLHNKFNVGDNPKFYNRIIQTSFGLDPTGKVCVKDEFGNISQVSVNDPRYLSGELESVAKGRVSVKDVDGNNYSVYINDPRYLSGELQHVRKGKPTGMVSVKDADGNNYSISINDPKYLSGELKAVTSNLKWIHNPTLKHNKRVNSDFSLPEGWIYGRKIYNNTNVGSKWIHSPNLKQNKRLGLECPLPDGWFYGRKIW